ncbi:hypothetical protein SUGI_0092420 [Cryptomeria japonica]|nr:hypothetical protein SUGI_0092420 [Cryptomeria japonica]
MASNTTSSAEKRFLVNPKDLRFTQPDIKSTFKDATHPSVRDTASLIQRGQLSPHELGDLHVSIDEQGHMWCDNNRRLFAYKEAGVDSVPVVFEGTRRPQNSLKSKLNDPDFMPRIRGQPSRVQIPPPPTSGQTAYQMQKEVSLPDWKGQLYKSHHDDEVEEELEARFTQLGINPSFSDPTYRSHRESVSSKQWGEVDPDMFGDPVVHRDQKGVMGCGNNAGESKRNDPASMPRIGGGALGVRSPPPPTSGWNAYQTEKETSLLDSVSAGHSKSQVYKSHEDHKVHYKYSYKEKVEVAVEYEYPFPYEEKSKVGYEYPFTYEDEGNVKGKVEYEYPFAYEDGGNVEGEVEYEYPVPCEANGYPFLNEDEGNEEGEVEYEYPVPCEGNGYPFSYEDEGKVEDEVEYEYPVYPVSYEDEDKDNDLTLLYEDNDEDNDSTLPCEDNDEPCEDENEDNNSTLPCEDEENEDNNSTLPCEDEENEDNDSTLPCEDEVEDNDSTSPCEDEVEDNDSTWPCEYEEEDEDDDWTLPYEDEDEGYYSDSTW